MRYREYGMKVVELKKEDYENLSGNNNNNNNTIKDLDGMKTHGKQLSDDLRSPNTTISSWIDNLNVYLHPKSVSALPLSQNYSSLSSSTTIVDHDIMNDTNDVRDPLLNYFDDTFSILKKQRSLEEYIGQLLFFLEESDSIQGFQTFCDASTGWGQFAQNYFEMIHDDIGPKIPLFTVGISAIGNPQINRRTIPISTTMKYKMDMNNCFSLVKLYHSSDIYIPVEVPDDKTWWKYHFSPYFENINPVDPIHTSSILACLLDSALIPFKMKEKESLMDMYSMKHLLSSSTSNLKLISLGGCIPFPISLESKNKKFVEGFSEILSEIQPIHLWNQMTSFTKGRQYEQLISGRKSNIPFSHMAVIRGVSSVMPLTNHKDTFLQGTMTNHNTADAFQNYFNRTPCPENQSHFDLIEQGTPVPTNHFPSSDIFSKLMFSEFSGSTSHGRIINNENSRNLVASFPMLSHLQNTSDILPMIQRNLELMKGFDPRKLQLHNFDIDTKDFYKDAIYQMLDIYQEK